MQGYNYYNQNMMSQLLRQKDNIENMINQYSQPPAPVQNIINTNNNVDFEARILGENEQVENILINRKTLFVDEKNERICIKETDGTISKEYKIILPKDEKDLKIEELENKIKMLEDKVNVKYAEPIRTINECNKSNADDDEYVEPSTKATDKSSQKTTKGETSRIFGKLLQSE